MSLYIVKKDGTHIEKHIPFTQPLSEEFIDTIKLIQADGHELDYIIGQYSKQTTFQNEENKEMIEIHLSIPLPYSKRVVRWYGDIAKTIIANL